jgi:sporulation protein YlmC with PRC-barrel domain
MQPYLDLSRQVLDRQVIDANNIECGKVDDLQIEGNVETGLVVKAILIGNRGSSERLPALLHWLNQKIFPHRLITVPWSEVLLINEQIKLKVNATDLGLDENQSWAVKIIGRLPGAWKK